MDKVAMRFGEVVLKTSQYEALKSWYSQLLDTKPMFESERKEDLGPGAMRQMCIIRPYSEFPFTETLVILILPNCDRTIRPFPAWITFRCSSRRSTIFSIAMRH